MSLTTDPHEHLIQMPPPSTGFHAFNPVHAELRGEHRAEPVPLISHRFMADIDAALVQPIFNVSDRKWKANVHHDSQPDNFGTAMNRHSPSGLPSDVKVA